MEADNQKSLPPVVEDPVIAGEAVAEYIAQQIPIPAIQATAPRATNEARLGDMAEPNAPRRWDDPQIVRRHPFEVYVVGQSGDGEWPTLACAWGVIGFATSCLQAITITDLTTTWQAEPDNLVWLEVQFDDDGVITAATLKHGVPNLTGWTGYPTMYELITGGYKWFHPIAEIQPFTPPQSGFIHILTDTGSFYHIAQYERNHLRPVKMCNEDGANYWMLQPGPGGPLT
jgi:hypothetical protein